MRSGPRADARCLNRLSAWADRVVGSNARKVEIVDRGVDQHHGDAALVQQAVMIMRSRHLSEVPASEHDARSVLVEQHLDVISFGQSAGREGAEHRREPALGQHAPDDLGERGEDGILQFGKYQADEPGALATELSRASSQPEHVERR